MTIEVDLKDEYKNQGGIYPTNTQEEIKSLIDDDTENVVSKLTPKLKNEYQVTYDANAPDGCSVENVPNTQNFSVFDTVTISDTEPKCTGYQFKGWKIATDEIKSINEDYFIMPEKDVIIRAEWSKVSVRKSMSGTVYSEKNLYKRMAKSSVLDNGPSEFVESSTGIDFASGSSDTNGKGIYELSSTKDDEYPVYYYRGQVTDNNVKFANFCWKIVRTTSTGGVKLVYNGLPDSNGACNNTGTSTQIGRSPFNSNNDSPADVGYMYGTRYIYGQQSMGNSTGFIYGNDVTYENGVYTLKDTMTSSGWSSDYQTIATKYHYTCFSTETTCSSVYYIQFFGMSNITYYLTLSDGKDIEDVKTEMFTNTNDSTIKTTIDNWYKNNMISYASYLEDTVWCNDRSISSGPLKGKDEDSSINFYTSFGGQHRHYAPSLVCQNINDSFTVNSSNGNGALTYPVALLTSDEATLAGHGFIGYSSSAYLNTGQSSWSLSPLNYYGSSARGFYISHRLGNYYVTSWANVRPSVSLKPGTVISDGDGSIETPYVIAN